MRPHLQVERQGPAAVVQLIFDGRMVASIVVPLPEDEREQIRVKVVVT